MAYSSIAKAFPTLVKQGFSWGWHLFILQFFNIILFLFQEW